jgi:hypothetical protein
MHHQRPYLDTNIEAWFRAYRHPTVTVTEQMNYHYLIEVLKGWHHRVEQRMDTPMEGNEMW